MSASWGQRPRAAARVLGRGRQRLCSARQTQRICASFLAMWTRSGTVLTVSSRALLAACERLGIDTSALLAAVGIDRRTIDDPDARLEATQVSALWTKAYELSRDPVLS